VSGQREVCPACRILGEKSTVRRLQTIAHDTDRCSEWHPRIIARWRYRCSRGHEFDGTDFKRDPCEECLLEKLRDQKESAEQ